ncbi:MAG TPA: chemoreceptor glutamine deamidase CheD [Spirochaetia bacterium]|nr:MAG: hypothetical protein A2Y41_07620 [Spirochaetes bacterium GWB1_36_13]HCL57979.1 chemoreceptor glutamine deamidase CheD [Spirochaetia bacterium]
MILKRNVKLNQYLFILYPGEYFVSGDDVIISTVLGSCVSVCLFDPVSRIGGMNHFMLPQDVEINEKKIYTSKTQYGIFAMDMIINESLKKGASKKNLQAKLFGGLFDEESRFQVGKNNIDFARKYLSLENIPIVSESIGGLDARKIYFYPHTGKTLVKKISNQNRIVEKIKEAQIRYAEQQNKENVHPNGFIEF